MNGYRIIFMLALIIVLIAMCGLGPEIKGLFRGIADIPTLNPHETDDPFLMGLAVRIVNLMIIIGIIRALVGSRD